MKTIQSVAATTVLLFALLFITTTAFSQQNALRVHPLSGKIAYERVFTPKISLSTTLKVLPSPININLEGFKVRNYNISPEVRFYIGKNREEVKPAGFYIAPYLRGEILKVDVETQSESDFTEEVKFKGNSLGGGFTLGYQWVTENGFNIGLAGGWGVSYFRFDDLKVTYEDGTTETEEFDGINPGIPLSLPQFRFSLGYAF